MIDFAQARRMMVEGQIRTQDVTDRSLLRAMLAVPREVFVPETKAAMAYLDCDVPVHADAAGRASRFLLEPAVLARLIQAAEIRATDRVLDVGCATGYSSAVLAALAAEVIALEEEPSLASAARTTLAKLGYGNVTVVTGPLVRGWPREGLYDVILVNGAIAITPDALLGQLAHGGRLVAVSAGAAPKAMIYRSFDGEVSGRPLFDAAAPLLPGFAAPAAFVF